MWQSRAAESRSNQSTDGGRKDQIESEQIKIISEETTGHSRSNRIRADNRAAQNRRRSGNSKAYNIRANNRSKQITSEQLKKKRSLSNQIRAISMKTEQAMEQSKAEVVRFVADKSR